jgi:hypothetical protein
MKSLTYLTSDSEQAAQLDPFFLRVSAPPRPRFPAFLNDDAWLLGNG